MFNNALKLLLLGFFVLSVSVQANDESKKDGQQKEQRFQARMQYEKEGNELRRAHIEEVRKKHLDLINKMYDLKISHLVELEEYGRKMETASPEERKVLMKALKEKRKEHKKAQHDFRDKTIKTELKVMREDFHNKMKQRREGMKNSKEN